MSSRENMSPEDKKNYFRNIVAMACADGEIKEREKALLNYVAQELQLDASVIDELAADPQGSEFVVPEDAGLRFDLLFDLTEMMIIDGVLKVAEKDFCLSLAEKLGYGESAVDGIVKAILDGNRGLKDEAAIREAARNAVS